jgi:hypothetical protein
METWEENLPYSLQPPFQPTDVYSRAYVVEDPDIYALPLDRWWTKTQPELEACLAGAADGRIVIRQFVWDEKRGSFESRTEFISKDRLRAQIAQLLGKPSGQLEQIGYSQAKNLVKELAGAGPNGS